MNAQGQQSEIINRIDDILLDTGYNVMPDEIKRRVDLILEKIFDRVFAGESVSLVWGGLNFYIKGTIYIGKTKSTYKKTSVRTRNDISSRYTVINKLGKRAVRAGIKYNMPVHFMGRLQKALDDPDTFIKIKQNEESIVQESSS
jgi:hypothetical protein